MIAALRTAWTASTSSVLGEAIITIVRARTPIFSPMRDEAAVAKHGILLCRGPETR
jgi:hypothetical protein